MHLEERMTLPPYHCMICGRGNPTDNDPHPVQFVDLERDVDWGDAAYLCTDCVVKLVDIAGFVSKDQLQEKEDLIAKKDEEIHELKATLDSTNRRVKQILSGSKAAKSLRSETEEAAA